MRGLPNALREKVQFSGHETFPLRQLWLKKAFDAIAAASKEQRATVFSSESAIANFGVGKNMVASIRHWALACNVIHDRENEYEPTEEGKLLFATRGGLDPYVEKPATPWLMHWMLAGRGLRSTTWFWIFNNVNAGSFRRDTLRGELTQLALESGKKRLSASTIDNDINVCIRCYLPAIGSDTTEDVIEPLLAELGLLSSHSRDVYEFRRGPKSTLPDGIFAYSLADFWRRWNSENGTDQATLSFDAIAHDYGSPGRVFKLDENSVGERLSRLDDVTEGRFRWSDSAGIRQVVRSDEALESCAMHGYLRSAYE
jgi:hypothetical protein